MVAGAGVTLLINFLLGGERHGFALGCAAAAVVILTAIFLGINSGDSAPTLRQQRKGEPGNSASNQGESPAL